MDLTPIRPNLALGMWTGLVLNPLGFLIVWPSVRHRTVSLVLFVAGAALFGVPMWIGWRVALKRVVPAPPGAILDPSRISPGRTLWSIGLPIVIVVLSLAGVQGPSVLGIGFGGALGSAWAVRKVGQFEREDGRCLARERAPWWGGTASRLYAA